MFDHDLALKIFTLGTRFGLDQAKLGFEPEKMHPDDTYEILRLGLAHYKDEIEKHLKGLTTTQEKLSWWACHMTAMDIYRIGLLEGFDQFEQIKPDKHGKRILTADVIDKLTQKVFAQFKSHDEALNGG